MHRDFSQCLIMFDQFLVFFICSVSQEDVPEKEPEAGEDAEKPVHSDHDQMTHICNFNTFT